MAIFQTVSQVLLLHETFPTVEADLDLAHSQLPESALSAAHWAGVSGPAFTFCFERVLISLWLQTVALTSGRDTSEFLYSGQKMLVLLSSIGAGRGHVTLNSWRGRHWSLPRMVERAWAHRIRGRGQKQQREGTRQAGAAQSNAPSYSGEGQGGKQKGSADH